MIEVEERPTMIEVEERPKSQEKQDQQPQPQQQNDPFQIADQNDETELHQPTGEQLERRKRVRKREVQEKQANDFLKQPVVKITNLKKDLKRAYQKGFLDDSKFDYIRSLRKIRKHPEQDSVSSHYGSDESFDIRDALPKKGFQRKRKINQNGDILSSSNSGEERPKRKRVVRVSKPKQEKKPKPKPKVPVKKEEEIQRQKRVSQTKPIQQKTEFKRGGVQIKVTKAPPGMVWKNDQNQQSKLQKKEKSQGSINKSESSFKSSSGDESEELAIQKIKNSQIQINGSKKQEHKEQQLIKQDKIQQKFRLEFQSSTKTAVIVPISKAQAPNPSIPPLPQNRLLPPNISSRKAQLIPTRSLQQQTKTMSNSSSQDSLSSSSSSSNSSSSSEDHHSREKRKQHHKYSSSDESSQDRKKRKRHKKHKKAKEAQMLRESLLKKVIQQQIQLSKKENQKAEQTLPPQNINQILEKYTQENMNKARQIIEESPKIKEEQINQQNVYHSILGEEKSSLIAIRQPLSIVQEKDKQELPNHKLKDQTKTQNSNNVQKNIEKSQIFLQKMQNPKNNDYENADANTPNQKGKFEQSSKSTLKNITTVDAKENHVQRMISQSHKSKRILESQKTENVKAIKQQIQEQDKKTQKRSKNLSFDNKVVVLQLMVGSSGKEKNLQQQALAPLKTQKQEKSLQINHKQQRQQSNRPQRRKPHQIIEEQDLSDDSQQATYYYHQRKPTIVPRKVVRYRKVIVQRTDSQETDSSSEQVQKRVIRRVRRPIQYEDESDNEDSVTDYRTDPYRSKAIRRQPSSFKGQK